MAVKIKKKVLNPRVPRTHNGNTMTSSEWHGKIISLLRQLSRWYIPPNQAKLQAKRKKPANVVGRHIYEYQCAMCKKWFKDGDIALDHIIEAGSMRTYVDLPDFCKRLFCEKEGFQVLCNNGKNSCHHKKTQDYMTKKRAEKKEEKNDR